APSLLAGAAVVWAYVIGLTYVAKQEKLGRVASLWPLLFLAAPFVYGAPVLASGTDAVLALVAGAAEAPALVFGTAEAPAVVSGTTGASTPASALAALTGPLLYLALLAWVGSTLTMLRGPKPAVGVVVARLIAGISLVDALVIARA